MWSPAELKEFTGAWLIARMSAGCMIIDPVQRGQGVLLVYSALGFVSAAAEQTWLVGATQSE